MKDHRQSTSQTNAGFTLFEVLLTLVIVAVMSAMSWPALQKPLANRRLHSAADEVCSELCQARNQAIRSGHIYIFCYELGGEHFRVESQEQLINGVSAAGNEMENYDADEEEYGSVSADDGGPEKMTLPEGIRFLHDDEGDDELAAESPASEEEAADGAVDWSDPVLFYPDGTASDAALLLANDHSNAVRLELRGITGTVTVADPSPSVE